MPFTKACYNNAMAINNKLLEILACPDCRGEIVYKKETKNKPEHLLCQSCKRKFEIDDGIPLMLPKGS